MSQTRYLVTGGAGFIGGHLTEALLERGDRVVVLDDLSTGRRSNLRAVEDRAGFRFVRGSVLDGLVVDELAHDCDVIVHLAAAVGVELIVEQPLRSFTTNIRGTETVLDAARRYGCRVLVASSSEIYGKNAAGPVRETDDRLIGATSVARWGYSTAKAVDEVLALAYHRERGLPAIVARFFNTVGPRQSPAYGMVIPRFVRQALEGRPVTVHGDGRQTRCFGHVGDVVDAVIRLLDDERATGEVFNVGNPGEEISILGLAERIVARTGSDSPIEFVPYEQAYEPGFEDMRRRVPDTSKLEELTGWRPTRDLDDMLADVIAEVRGARPLVAASA